MTQPVAEFTAGPAGDSAMDAAELVTAGRSAAMRVAAAPGRASPHAVGGPGGMSTKPPSRETRPTDPGQESQSSEYAGARVLNVANAECEWDDFPSQRYYEHNYQRAREVDVRFATRIADFFAANTPPLRNGGRAIDVGAGANLYPALAMLPFASTIVLAERSKSNRRWLRNQIAAPEDSWARFWGEISDGRRRYDLITDFRRALRDRADIRAGDVFQLPRGEYDLGTMFFVAESITTWDKEFRAAVKSFVQSLRRGAPFAAAFMKDSSGYRVAGRDYPACPIDESDIGRCLAGIARGVEHVIIKETEVRDGHQGMILVTGRASGRK